jgi:hypothetical protein
MPKAPSVNRSYDVPYLAGMSKDGSTIYIDRNLPHQIDVGGKKFDPALSLGLHELTEYRAMEGAGMKWEPAHKRLANVAERRWLQSRGVDWRHYEEIMDGYLSHMEREKIDNPPPDLYIKPYPADMRHKLVTHGVAKAEGGEVGIAHNQRPNLDYVNKNITPLSQSINRQKDILPSTSDPTPEELAAAKADTRSGGDIVNQRLRKIVPESSRVVDGKYRPGAPGGGRWADLPKEVLNKNGVGFNVKDEELNELWAKSVEESSQAAKNAVKEHKVNPKFLAKDWDAAMRLPIKDHLWYELSGEKMIENMPDLTPEEHLKGMDLVGATSARAEPGENLERALSVLSQHMRGVPVDVDLTQQSAVRDALSRDHRQGSSALSGNKTGNFSDTLALTGGVGPTRFPISVNDVWVGKMFGIDDDVMSSNQSLHEPMAIYFNKIRDLYNERHGHETPFKYQSWNFQAPAWVHLRNQPSGDAYHQVWGGIINKLKNSEVNGIEGDKITRKAFMDPKFADALRRTTPGWRNSSKATIEFGTKLTPVGQQAHDLYSNSVSAGDLKSQQEYLNPLVTAMYHSARGKNHPWEMLKKAITGNLTSSSDITRIIHPTTEKPFDVGGTFEGALSPNIRIPLKDMDDDQIKMFNAIAGKHLKQAAMAASTVNLANKEEEPAPGHIRGHSIFIQTRDPISDENIKEFSKHLSAKGHELSFVRYPNGYKFDVNPRFDKNSSTGISDESLAGSYGATLKKVYGFNAQILPHDYKSVYNEASEYEQIRSKLKRKIKDDYLQAMAASEVSKGDARSYDREPSSASSLKGGGRKAWDTYQQRLDYLSRAEKGFQNIAQSINKAHKGFLVSAGKRRQKLGYNAGGFIPQYAEGDVRASGGIVEGNSTPTHGSVWHKNDMRRK